ncbi:MAG: hypothetical protein ABWY52_08880 [Candidatus Limnocylindrales bacterium]
MSELRLRLPRSIAASGFLLAIALVAAACTGASGPSASSAPDQTSAPATSEPATSEPGATAAPAGSASAAPAGTVCEDLTAFEASIEALGELDLSAGGTATLTAAIGVIKTSAETLKASASTELASALDALTTQIDALQTAVSQLDQGDPGAGLVAVGTAIRGLVTAAQGLEAEFRAACP